MQTAAKFISRKTPDKAREFKPDSPEIKSSTQLNRSNLKNRPSEQKRQKEEDKKDELERRLKCKFVELKNAKNSGANDDEKFANFKEVIDAAQALENFHRETYQKNEVAFNISLDDGQTTIKTPDDLLAYLEKFDLLGKALFSGNEIGKILKYQIMDVENTARKKEQEKSQEHTQYTKWSDRYYDLYKTVCESDSKKALRAENAAKKELIDTAKKIASDLLVLKDNKGKRDDNVHFQDFKKMLVHAKRFEKAHKIVHKDGVVNWELSLAEAELQGDETKVKTLTEFMTSLCDAKLIGSALFSGRQEFKENENLEREMREAIKETEEDERNLSDGTALLPYYKEIYRDYVKKSLSASINELREAKMVDQKSDSERFKHLQRVFDKTKQLQAASQSIKAPVLSDIKLDGKPVNSRDGLVRHLLEEKLFGKDLFKNDDPKALKDQMHQAIVDMLNQEYNEAGHEPFRGNQFYIYLIRLYVQTFGFESLPELFDYLCSQDSGLQDNIRQDLKHLILGNDIKTGDFNGYQLLIITLFDNFYELEKLGVPSTECHFPAVINISNETDDEIQNIKDRFTKTKELGKTVILYHSKDAAKEGDNGLTALTALTETFKALQQQTSSSSNSASALVGAGSPSLFSSKGVLPSVSPTSQGKELSAGTDNRSSSLGG